MGIVFDTKVGQSYNSESTCREPISRRAPLKKLTPRNLHFLKSLGLKVTESRGKKRRK